MKRIYIPVNKFFLSILSSEYNVASWTAKKNHQQQNKKQQLSITNMETINSIDHRKTSVTILEVPDKTGDDSATLPGFH